MEDTLRELQVTSAKTQTLRVLILVLMEDTLRAEKRQRSNCRGRLNPCFNGRYSQRLLFDKNNQLCDVLILVLMEDTLRGIQNDRYVFRRSSLNPCFNGRYSQSYVESRTNVHFEVS